MRFPDYFLISHNLSSKMTSSQQQQQQKKRLQRNKKMCIFGTILHVQKLPMRNPFLQPPVKDLPDEVLKELLTHLWNPGAGVRLNGEACLGMLSV